MSRYDKKLSRHVLAEFINALLPFSPMRKPSEIKLQRASGAYHKRVAGKIETSAKPRGHPEHKFTPRIEDPSVVYARVISKRISS
jgi:hypothetical protein